MNEKFKSTESTDTCEPKGSLGVLTVGEGIFFEMNDQPFTPSVLSSLVCNPVLTLSLQVNS